MRCSGPEKIPCFLFALANFSMVGCLYPALQLEDWLIEVCSLFLPVLTYAYRVNDWLQFSMSSLAETPASIAFLMWLCAFSLLWCRILADLVFPVDYHECFMPSLSPSFPFFIMSKSIYTSPHRGDSRVIMYIN